MGITLLTNVAALKAQRQLALHAADLAAVTGRLSSGLRINNASDDPAGLAMADVLRADQRVANAAVRNANDGISMLSIADSALIAISNILQRCAELAENAANGLQTTISRSPFQSEFVALSSEITRIARAAQFNNILLLSVTSAGRSPIVFQVGLNAAATSQISFSGVTATLEALALADAGENLQYSLNDCTNEAGRQAALTTLTAVKRAIDTVSSTRGVVGAAESRLSFAVSNLQTQRDAFHTAESQIRDADVAADAAELIRKRILTEAAAAVLTQANQQPSIVLKLLG